MEDEKDRTPAFGTEIIREPIIDDGQTADLDKRPRINWRKGYIRLAIALSPIWILISFFLTAASQPSDRLDYFQVLSIIGLIVLWVGVPLLVYIIKWIIGGFADKPEDQ